MRVRYQGATRFLSIAVASLFLAACGSGSNIPPAAPLPPPPPPPPTASFDVTVTNLTNAQPLSPIAVIAHLSGYDLFTVGSSVTVGFEDMAEGGDNMALLAEADADADSRDTGTGMAPIGPAGSETVTLTVFDSARPGLLISVGTMLVNTNDAFTGLDGAAIESMAVGDVLSFRTVAYDAGTEADTEQAIHIPGPAGGGEGFNADRDDQADLVTMHSGIVSQDDGFATSDLTEQHRFDNPTAMVRIVRTQ